VAELGLSGLASGVDAGIAEPSGPGTPLAAAIPPLSLRT
jgi:hypothetical protein